MIFTGARYGLAMADFDHEDMRGSRFYEVDLRDSSFRDVYFKNVTMRGCLLDDVVIDGEFATSSQRGRRRAARRGRARPPGP